MSVYCYGCQRTSNITHHQEDDLTCPLCGSDFVEAVEDAASNPQSQDTVGGMQLPPGAHTHAVHRSFRSPSGTNVALHVTTTVVPVEGQFANQNFMNAVRDALRNSSTSDGVNAFVFQFLNEDGGATPLNPGAIQFGDFAVGSGLDQILTQLMESHQPMFLPTARATLDALPRRRVPPASGPAPEAQRSCQQPCPAATVVASTGTGDAEEKPDEEDVADGELAACRAGEPCTVCHDDFIEGEEVLELPCKHCFHGECITPWLETHNTCPVCRHELPGDAARAVEESRRRRGMEQPRVNSAAANDAGAANPVQRARSRQRDIFARLPDSLPDIFRELPEHFPPSSGAAPDAGSRAAQPSGQQMAPDGAQGIADGTTAAARQRRQLVARARARIPELQARFMTTQHQLQELQGQLAQQLAVRGGLTEEVQNRRAALQAQYEQLQSTGQAAALRISALRRRRQHPNGATASAALAPAQPSRPDHAPLQAVGAAAAGPALPAPVIVRTPAALNLGSTAFDDRQQRPGAAGGSAPSLASDAPPSDGSHAGGCPAGSLSTTPAAQRFARQGSSRGEPGRTASEALAVADGAAEGGPSGAPPVSRSVELERATAREMQQLGEEIVQAADLAERVLAVSDAQSEASGREAFAAVEDLEGLLERIWVGDPRSPGPGSQAASPRFVPHPPAATHASSDEMVRGGAGPLAAPVAEAGPDRLMNGFLRWAGRQVSRAFGSPAQEGQR